MGILFEQKMVDIFPVCNGEEVEMNGDEEEEEEW